MLFLLLSISFGNPYPEPDGFGVSFRSSQDDLGPPFSTLHLQNGFVISSNQEPVEIDLPFVFHWYGEEQEHVFVHSNSVLSFDGTNEIALQDLCSDQPSSSTTSIVALDHQWQPYAIRWGEFGAFPYRIFAVEWTGIHTNEKGQSNEGTVQIWLTEGNGNSQATIVWDDVRYISNEEVAEGLEDVESSMFFAGTLHPNENYGVSIGCEGEFEIQDHTSILLSTEFSTSTIKNANTIDRFIYTDEHFSYLGRSLDVTDINNDGFADIVLGVPDQNEAYLFFGDLDVDDSWTSLDGSSVKFASDHNGEFGYAVQMDDINGDGFHDVMISAPKENTTFSNAGVLYIWDGNNIQLMNDVDDAHCILEGDENFGSPKSGISLHSGDINGDGYSDILIGAPYADIPSSNAGAVFLWQGNSGIFEEQYRNLSESQAVFVGDQTAAFAGEFVFVGDINDDELAEFTISAPQYDDIAQDVGRVSLFAGGVYSGMVDITSSAQVHFWGSNYDDKIGVSVKMGDWDGDGVGDLLIGAPYVSEDFVQQGAVFGYSDALGWFGDFDISDADIQIQGNQNSAHLGQDIEIFDFDGDMDPDLLVSVPNHNEGSVGGGSILYFDDFIYGTKYYDESDLRLLGNTPAGALGTKIEADGDVNGDGHVDLVVAAPFADVFDTTGSGKILIWNAGIGFTDQDQDGFVHWADGGIDCDDSNENIFPSQIEVENLMDDDCDGWIDDVLMFRPFEDWWIFESEVLGIFDPELYDFEDGMLGEVGSSLYSPMGIHIFSSEAVVINSQIWGTPARNSKALKVINDGFQNQLRIYFDEDIDAFGFYALDVDGILQITTMNDGDVQISDVPIYRSADNKHGGVFVGLIFETPVDYVSIDSAVDNGYGIDDMFVAWSDQSDRDGDGFSEEEGDCNDQDDNIHPDMSEKLGNGTDDDCDGNVDAGNTSLMETQEEWLNWIGEHFELEGNWELTKIDFEILTVGEMVETQYEDLGVLFHTGHIANDIDGALPIDQQALQIENSSSLSIHFQDIQPTVGLSLIDVAGDILIEGYIEEELLYTKNVNIDNENIDEGLFLALLFDVGVDTIKMTNASSYDVWGIDNVLLLPSGFDDADGDGFSEHDGDCNDQDAEIFPGANEIFYDGIDQDCSDFIAGIEPNDEYDSDFDADGDGYVSSLWGGNDCDDVNVLINPSADEIWYDGVDQNCDGFNDYDADMDGFATAEYTYGTGVIVDCDDGNASVNPDAQEIFYDDVDDNCQPGDDFDADGDGYPSGGYGGAGGMQGGTFVIIDCDDYDPTISPGAEEIFYDGIDSDCNSESTDFDADGDGFDAAIYGGDDCDDIRNDVYPNSPFEKWYDGIDSDCLGNDDYDQDGDGYRAEIGGGDDCDDLDALIHPDMEDIEGDGVDSNCDKLPEFDDDGDGFDGVEDGGTDCDDLDASISPNADETWYDGVDQNCDGADDYDQDGDGYRSQIVGGLDCDDAVYSIHPNAEDYPYDNVDSNCDGQNDFDMDGDGFETIAYGGDDCNDFDSMIHPNRNEIWYDGVDQNCDGLHDYDADGDGQYAMGFENKNILGEDCDDNNPSVFVGAFEIIADGIDQNCDGVDDVDSDGDGFFSLEDCDDEHDSIHPDATEIWYDGVDQNCDQLSDFDMDGDGSDSSDYIGLDCDDQDANIYPDATEIWYDGVDQNCDGLNDYDADGDGYIAENYGGLDCEDYHATIHPDILVDDCGGGNEDCDDQIDEDCGANTTSVDAEDEENTDSSVDFGSEGDSSQENSENENSENENSEAGNESSNSDETGDDIGSEGGSENDDESNGEDVHGEDEDNEETSGFGEKGGFQNNETPSLGIGGSSGNGNSDTDSEEQNNTEEGNSEEQQSQDNEETSSFGEKGGLQCSNTPSWRPNCGQDTNCGDVNDNSCHGNDESEVIEEENCSEEQTCDGRQGSNFGQKGNEGNLNSQESPSLGLGTGSEDPESDSSCADGEETGEVTEEDDKMEEQDGSDEENGSDDENSGTGHRSGSGNVDGQSDEELGDLNQYYDEDNSNSTENSSNNGYEYEEWDTGNTKKHTSFYERAESDSCAGCHATSSGNSEKWVIWFSLLIFLRLRRRVS